MPDETLKRRIFAVDFLRGIVMMIMMIDHTREYVHTGALLSDPTNLASNPTVATFFTRWITHFCAPIFVFLAGTSIYLQKLNGKSRAELSRFLWTRGLWLIVLEFTVIRFLIVFNLDYSFFGMGQVIWVIGVSMIVMAALIYLPLWLVGASGILMIVLHNLLDGIRIPLQTAFAGNPPPDLWQSLWLILHQPGIVQIFGGSSQIFFAYPLIPWIGVMAVGYVLGAVYSQDSATRRKWLLILGLGSTVLFIVLRGINLYGDPAPWAEQSSPLFTFLSFLNTTKYPPSLLFLLMTLGPAILVLYLTDGIDGKGLWERIIITYGRVPMFYYILQWVVAHGSGVLLGVLAGVDVSYLFKDILSMGRDAPPGHGFPLWVVYAVWITGLIILYPLCAWYSELKRRKKHWILSYL